MLKLEDFETLEKLLLKAKSARDDFNTYNNDKGSAWLQMGWSYERVGPRYYEAREMLEEHKRLMAHVLAAQLWTQQPHIEKHQHLQMARDYINKVSEDLLNRQQQTCMY